MRRNGVAICWLGLVALTRLLLVNFGQLRCDASERWRHLLATQPFLVDFG